MEIALCILIVTLSLLAIRKQNQRITLLAASQKSLGDQLSESILGAETLKDKLRLAEHTLALPIKVEEWHTEIDQLKSQFEKLTRDLEEALSEVPVLEKELTKVTGAVIITKPNGSFSPAETAIEGSLSRKGASLRSLPKSFAIAASNGEQLNLPSGVGYLVCGIAAEREIESATKTRRHIHTATGMFFHDLPKDHPEYREEDMDLSEEENSIARQFGFPNNYSFSDEYWVYFEKSNQFTARKERESAKHTVITVSLNFYSSKGEVLGGIVVEGANYEEVTWEFSQKGISELINSFAVHAAKQALA